LQPSEAPSCHQYKVPDVHIVKINCRNYS
jgi:hypothetical protein